MKPTSDRTQTVNHSATINHLTGASITLADIVQSLPENLPDQTVDTLLESLYYLESAIFERYHDSIMRLAHRDHFSPPDDHLDDESDYEGEDFIPF